MFNKWLTRDPIIGNGLIVLLFFGLGFIIYSNTLDSPFVFDDESQILENNDIRLEDLSVESLIKAAFGRQSGRTRPVGNLSFALNYIFHQYRLTGYHLLNIIIHIITGILLWLISVRTGIQNSLILLINIA